MMSLEQLMTSTNEAGGSVDEGNYADIPLCATGRIGRGRQCHLQPRRKP